MWLKHHEPAISPAKGISGGAGNEGLNILQDLKLRAGGATAR